MSCNSNLITEALGLNCENNVAGIKTMYITEFGNVTSYTAVDGEITGITMSTISASPLVVGTFYEVKPSTKDTSSYTENAQIDLNNGATFWQQQVILQLTRREALKRQYILTLIAAQKDLTIIVLDNNGIYWIFGLGIGAQVLTLDGGSGVVKNDLNGYTITFQAHETEQALTIDPDLIAGIIESA
jgi:hypothetical protein